MAGRLYIVMPCYNEQEVLPETSRRIRDKMGALAAAGRIAPDSRVLLVDDGSADQTWALIEGLHREDKLFSGLKLTRNRGHQNALLAGLMAAAERCDMSISMDADLQDDLGVIDGFLDRWEEGCDIVYGVRSDRSSDSAFKRSTAQGFYRFQKRMGVDTIYNHADCRLMSRRALEALAEFPERNLFLRGMVPLIGYRTAVVEYPRCERFAGESKYPLRRMLGLAFEGITSFSVRPLQTLVSLGLLVLGVSLLVSLYSLIAHLAGWPFRGWSPLLGSLWVLGGVQLAALGLVGQYVGKLYAEAKARPRYLVEELLDEGEGPGKRP